MPEDPRTLTPLSIPPPPPEPEAASVAIRPGSWWIPVTAIIVTGYLYYSLRGVLTPFILAAVLAYVLKGPVDLMARVRIPRTLGAILVFGVLLTVLIFAFDYASRYIQDELEDIGKQLPNQIEAWGKRLEPWLAKNYRFRLPHNITDAYARYGVQIRENLPQAVNYVTAFFFGTLSYAFLLLSLLIVPVFAFFLVIDFPSIILFLGRLVPVRWQTPVFAACTEIDKMATSYLRGQFLAMLILSALYSTGLSYVGLRLAVPIGILTGCLGFVPYLGWSIGFMSAIAMALIDWQGLGSFVQVLAVMLSIYAIDSLFITPRVVGSAVGLTTIEVLLSMAVMGTLLGFFGILFAVPLGGAVKIMINRIVVSYRRSAFFRRSPPGSRPAFPTQPSTPSP
jgi:predicted PurR-regulated permease PerM